MAVKKKAVTKKKSVAKKRATKKKVVAKKKVAVKKNTASKKKSRTAAKKTEQVKRVPKPSVRTQGAGSIAPAIPPGFQGQEEKAVLEPFVPVHQATKRTSAVNTPPVSHWNTLEPMVPPPKVEEVVEEPVEEMEPPVPTTLIEQVLMESRMESKRPFAIQPRFIKPAEVEEVVEAPVAPRASAQRKTEISEYLSVWGGQPQPERQAVVEEMMVAAASSETQQDSVAVTEPVVAAESEPTTPAPRAEEPAAEAVATTMIPVEEEVASPLASRTSMLDAVHAVATQAEQQSAVSETDESSERMAQEVNHTDQVAEVIRMIEEEETFVTDQEETLKSATEADPKGDFSAEIQAAVEEDELDEMDDPHFNEALDKIAGTRADDSQAVQRREAIRHFTESAARKRKERRNRVATGAPSIIGGLPASTAPKDTRVEVESLGGGILHLLASGARGVASFGRYSLMGVKYGLKDSKSALGKLTSRG